MYSLILDSSYKNLTVGIAKDNIVLDEVDYECYQRQSELLIVEIEKILKKNCIDSKQINEILVTVGPGSYTGVRIALTIAKVYSYALKINCYAFSSLKVLQKEDVPSICLMNARSNRSYIGVYLNNEVIISDTVLSNEKVIEYIGNHSDFALCGDLSYLEKEGYKASLSANMIRLKSEDSLVKDIMGLKAIYLKD